MTIPPRGRITATIALGVLVLNIRVAFAHATVRATLETALMVSAFTSALLLTARVRRTRRLADLLVVIAVLALAMQEFEFSALPSILNLRRDAVADSILAARAVVAISFLAAALCARSSRTSDRRQAGLLVVATTACMGMIGLAGIKLGHGASATGLLKPFMHSTPEIALTVVVGIVMVASAAIFLRGSAPGRVVVDEFAAHAAFLLAAAWLYDLQVPAFTPGWVTGREGLRALAYGCILAAALHTRADLRRADQELAIRRERRRLAYDLHDGLAQDLAFIAMRGREVEQQLGSDHPIAEAARRALAASRGAMAQLAGEEAPTAAAALEMVAQELARRHGVRVTVETDGTELAADARSEVVRIAREAIVNAIVHGQPSRVVVSLRTREGHVILKIRDDGVGIRSASAAGGLPGHGLRAMRERAQAIGGRLMMGRAADGGTEIELFVS
jgi:signal transduction histidine kinase